MSVAATSRTFRALRRAAFGSDGGGRSDAELLDAFLRDRDELAIEALIRRHGPLVLGVCRRLLGNPHDAADAFQVVFLVLVQKSGSIRSRRDAGLLFPSFCLSGGTFGGGGGGGEASSVSSTHFPRRTTDVRSAYEVTVKTLPCPNKPCRAGSVTCIRLKWLPYTSGTP